MIPAAPRPARLVRAFHEFVKLESAGGVLLLAAALAALGWANSPWAESYARLFATVVTVGAGPFQLAKPLALWINDGLMAVFFFVVGLEIKREVLVGELSTARQAALPAAAALGGMVVPALLYFAFTAGTPAVRGWGIPMATDIAFALGVMALLGKGAPLALKVFLTALAIVDDLGAVLVIALLYTESLSLPALGLAAVVFAVMVTGSALGMRRPAFYAVLGAVLWVAVLKSGVHATIAGVLAALTIPARAERDTAALHSEGRAWLDRLAEVDDDPASPVRTKQQHEAVYALGALCEAVESPLQRLEHGLHPWVTFFIMPVFALANAGVALAGGGEAAGDGRVTLAVAVGLVVGKPLGITLAAWLATRAGVASLPAGVSWRQIAGTGAVAGIGFTMSLFIAELAFSGAPALDRAKLGILIASAIAGLTGAVTLWRAGAPANS